MKSLLEIHDSVLAAIEPDGQDVILHFAPAYVHLWEATADIEPGSGCLQDFDLVISGAVLESLPSVLPADLCEGAISLGESRWDNALALPFAVRGELFLAAVTSNGQALAIRGTGAALVPRGPIRFLERLPWAADDAPQ